MFATLNYKEQVRRLTALARASLPHYGHQKRRARPSSPTVQNTTVTAWTAPRAALRPARQQVRCQNPRLHPLRTLMARVPHPEPPTYPYRNRHRNKRAELLTPFKQTMCPNRVTASFSPGKRGALTGQTLRPNTCVRSDVYRQAAPASEGFERYRNFRAKGLRGRWLTSTAAPRRAAKPDCHPRTVRELFGKECHRFSHRGGLSTPSAGQNRSQSPLP